MPWTEVRKVWRNTTQAMCNGSGFFEQCFPLVRAINQKLPPGKRLRVLAGDPPIDWDQIKNSSDSGKFDREASIASVMEKEVLSKHRKALMLFGELHLMHSQEDSSYRYGETLTLFSTLFLRQERPVGMRATPVVNMASRQVENLAHRLELALLGSLSPKEESAYAASRPSKTTSEEGSFPGILGSSPCFLAHAQYPEI